MYQNNDKEYFGKKKKDEGEGSSSHSKVKANHQSQ